MKNKSFFAQSLLAMAMLFCFTAATSFGQCVIPITDSQPFIEGFEEGGFDCWTVETVGNGNWAPMAGTETTVAAFTYQNVGDEARLISPTLDFSAVDAATFSFSFAMMGFYENDELVVSYRSSETDDWHDLGTFSLSDYANIYEEIFDLENLSSTYQVSFLGRGLGGMYIFVDNIEVSSAAGCARPVNLQATDITAFSAWLNWSTTGNEDGWTISLNGMETAVATQPYLMEGLTPNTEYTFSVKAKCSGGLHSEWATPITFTTHCDVITVTDEVPYFDDFEADEDFICWQNEIVSGIDNWVVDPGYLILNNTAFFIWLGGTTRLISAPLDITAVTNPTIEFKHKQMQGEFNVDELSVWYRTSPTDEWKLIEIYIYATDGWETAIYALPEPSATYQICFMGVGHDGEGVYVDDVRVGNDGGVGLVEAPAVEAVISPNPTKDKVMVEANVATGEVVVFDLFGKQVASAQLQDGHAELDLSAFAKGVYVAHISSEAGTSTIKLVKE